MTCSRCGSDRLFQFEAHRALKAPPPPHELPVVCRSCGLITIDGKTVHFPLEFEKEAKEIAEKAAEVAKKTKEGIYKDPGARVETYFTNVYRRGYLDGFWRALAFFRHQAKEGRLVRLRELWDGFQAFKRHGEPGTSQPMVSIRVTEAEYDEFKTLLHLNVVPK